VISVPPPATALIIPATKAAARMEMLWLSDTRAL
jgi:hypothetical protein